MVTIPTFHLDPFYALRSQYIGVVPTENRGCNGISSFPILHLQDYARANSQGDSKLAASSKQNINIWFTPWMFLSPCKMQWYAWSKK